VNYELLLINTIKWSVAQFTGRDAPILVINRGPKNLNRAC